MRKLYSDVPETISVRSTELDAEKRRLANFIQFIGEGRGSQAFGKALAETERRVQVLEEEVEGLQLSRRKGVQQPPI